MELGFVIEPLLEKPAEPIYIKCMGKDYHVCNKKNLLNGCPIPDLCFQEMSSRLDHSRSRRFLFLHNKVVAGDGFSVIEVPSINMYAIYMEMPK